ncbi:porin [Mesorhizobium sp. 1M-11]|uniref:porin n=1 Tax=Mesorhizobium sp. 1M-11 TaxID=1529006 RepID=UPI0006C75E99|nr:porin [Mesorhizobium sp. 1M-11]
MNIKSLLLGCAAALIAVPPSHAADAVVVAEAEPAEPVKICDVYGPGYFYIPGTETCLRIGGYVRYDIGLGDGGTFDGVNHVPDQMGKGTHSTWKKQARLQLDTSTGQETEFGTLKTFTITRFDFGNSGGDYADPDGSGPLLPGTRWRARNKDITLIAAWIQLGGLRVGKDDSAFDAFIDYAGNVIQDSLIPYGGFDSNVVQYNFDGGNGLSGVISLEQGSDDGSGDNSIDSYVPNVVGGVKYKQSWGTLTAVGAYDSNYEEWAGKARLDVTLAQGFDVFVLAGYGTDRNAPRNFFKEWGGNWAIWAGGTYAVNNMTSLNAQVSYDGSRNLALAANVKYDIVPGFRVTAEADYLHVGAKDGYSWSGAVKKNNVGGILRFQRSF